MFYTYILASVKFGKHYIGSTGNLEERLRRHNCGLSRYTKVYLPWKIVYWEEFQTRKEAVVREREIKKYKGNQNFKDLICRGGGVDNRTRL